MDIVRSHREILSGHSSFCLWLTGLSGAGKSTIANSLVKLLHNIKIHTYILDGDNLRTGINSDLGFNEQDRSENIRRIGQIAHLMVDAGIVTVVAVISPFQEDRDKVKKIFDKRSIFEIYIDCPLEICVQRDAKGLYKKAQEGIIGDFTGVHSRYEPPSNPDITINSAVETVSEAVQKIYHFLQENNLL